MRCDDLDKVIVKYEGKLAVAWACFYKTERAFAKFSKASRALDTNVKGKIGDQWHNFVENFLISDLLKIFQARGIHIKSIHHRVKASFSLSNVGGQTMEIEILAVNTEYAILIETKHTFDDPHITRHLKRLARFKEFFPEYKEKKIVGAVAAVEFINNSNLRAALEGLIIISLGSDAVEIINNPEFSPKCW